MNFSAERIAEVMSHLDPNVRTRGGQEKRRAPRRSQQADLSIIPYTTAGPGEALKVRLRDFSSRGVRLVHKDALPHGSQFIIMLPRRGEKPVAMLCTVAHCKEIDGGFSIGAEFVCIAPPLQPANTTGPNSDVDRIRKSMLG